MQARLGVVALFTLTLLACGSAALAKKACIAVRVIDEDTHGIPSLTVVIAAQDVSEDAQEGYCQGSSNSSGDYDCGCKASGNYMIRISDDNNNEPWFEDSFHIDECPITIKCDSRNAPHLCERITAEACYSNNCNRCDGGDA